MKTLFLSLFLFVAFSIYGEESNSKSVPDSLKSLLPDVSGVNKTNLLIEIADSYYKIEKFNEALSNYSEALSYCETGNKQLKASLYCGTAATLIKLGKLEEGLSLTKKSKEIAEELKNKKIIAHCYINTGMACFYMRKHHEARINYNHALSIYTQLKDKLNLMHTLILMGKSWQGNHDSALVCLHKAEKLQCNDHAATSLLYHSIGHVYAHRKPIDRNKALSYYNKALEINHYTGNSYKTSWIYYSIGLLVYHNQEVYDKALSYYDKSLVIAKKNHNNILLSQIYSSKYKIYLITKQQEKAFNELGDYIQINDSITKNQAISDNNLSYSLLKTKNLVANFEKKNLTQKIQLQEQRYLLIASVTLLFLLSIIITLFIRQNKLKHKLLQKEQQRLTLEISGNITEKQQLEKNLELKQRELTSQALFISHRNDLLSRIQKNIQKLLPNVPKKTETKLLEIEREILGNMNMQKDWDNFKLHFDKVHPDFFNNLKNNHPELTQNNLKLCAYIEINLSNKEIGQLLNISESSVRIARNRLKEKLGIL